MKYSTATVVVGLQLYLFLCFSFSLFCLERFESEKKKYMHVLLARVNLRHDIRIFLIENYRTESRLL